MLFSVVALSFAASLLVATGSSIPVIKAAFEGLVSIISYAYSGPRSIYSIVDTSSSYFQANLAHMIENNAGRLLLFDMFNYDYIKRHMAFYLYTRQNLLYPDELLPNQPKTINVSHYQPANRTVILVHGFSTSAKEADSVQLIKNELLKNDDVNVIGVDWGYLAELPITSVCMPCGLYIANIQATSIGRCIGEMVSDLIDAGQSPNTVHMMGHSIGAHIAGFAGKYLNSIGKPIHRITGLDPSSMGFINVAVGHRLAENDAQFTDCLFTAAKTMGVRDTPCQANFFPNGCAVGQPGCPHESTYPGGCSHSRVVYLFAESINTKPTDFPTKQCDRMPCVGNDATCWPTNRTVMGYWADPKVRGIFYTETNGESPYLRRTG